jgi:serine/threonine-protein phosphatase CPPED1
VSGFRFVFMADCQLGCYATFSGMTPTEVEWFAARDMRVEAVHRVEGWEWDAQQLHATVAAANTLDPAFVIIGGDMVDDPEDAGQYDAVRRITAELHGPVHWVPGNHDCATDATAPTSQSLAAYRGRFGPDHHAFEHEGSFFVIVNTAVLAHPEHVPDELDRQLAFLESALHDATRAGARHILAFGHHPLFTRDADEPDSYWNVPQPQRRTVLQLLDAFGVRAFFSGHWHRNGGGWAGGLEVVVSGPVGYPLGADPSGFRIVDVTDDGVAHRYVALDEMASLGPSDG